MSEHFPSAPQAAMPEMQLTAEKSNAARRIPPWVAIAGLVAIVLPAGVVGFFIGRASGTSSRDDVAAQQQAGLKKAYERCRFEDAGGALEIADNGATIVVDTGSQYGSTAGVDCVFDALGTPESIKAQVGRTTAMMGVQDADHQGVHYSWSYHPDNGLNMVIETGS